MRGKPAPTDMALLRLSERVRWLTSDLIPSLGVKASPPFLLTVDDFTKRFMAFVEAYLYTETPVPARQKWLRVLFETEFEAYYAHAMGLAGQGDKLKFNTPVKKMLKAGDSPSVLKYTGAGLLGGALTGLVLGYKGRGRE